MLGIQQDELDCSDILRLRNHDNSDFSGNVLGSLHATMTYGDESIDGWINVMSSLSKPLSSWSHARALRIVPQEFPTQIPSNQDTVQHIRHSSSSLLPSSSSSPTLAQLSRQSSTDIKSKFLQDVSDVLVTKDDLKNGVRLNNMIGPPMKIHLKENAKPFALHTAR